MPPFDRAPWAGRRLQRVTRASVIAFALCVVGCHFDPTPGVPHSSPQPIVPVSPEELIQNLVVAYQRRDFLVFENLFPNAEDNAPYLHLLAEPLPDGRTSLDLAEELRIHRRMFDPETPLPGETPVPQELWLQSITITLTPLASFSERPDLYRSPTNPDGLDPGLWRATEGVYQAELLFDTQSTTDYRVSDRVNFVVIENLNKAAGEDRKFLIYRWIDLGGSGIRWSGVTGLYQ